jgi:hypothetical protein
MLPGLGAVIGITLFLNIVIATVVTFLILVSLAYVALRVQDARQPVPDSRLGMKFAFHTIHTTAVLLALFGLSVFMVDVTEGLVVPPRINQPNFGGRPAQITEEWLNMTKRIAFALVGSGALFGVVFWAFLLGTNDGEQRSVRRVFVGGRMALCLLITMLTITGLIINLALKVSDDRLTEVLIGLLSVWFPAGVVHMLLFFNNVNRKSVRRSGDDDDDRPWRPER